MNFGINGILLPTKFFIVFMLHKKSLKKLSSRLKHTKRNVVLISKLKMLFNNTRDER